jgi:hypothetical protein
LDEVARRRRRCRDHAVVNIVVAITTGVATTKSK